MRPEDCRRCRADRSHICEAAGFCIGPDAQPIPAERTEHDRAEELAELRRVLGYSRCRSSILHADFTLDD